MSDINIKECISDKTSQFNIKRFSIGGRTFEFPEKTFDTKFVRQKSFNSQNKKEIIENSKYVKDFSQIRDIANAEEDSKVDKFFQDKKWASDFFQINNITLCFNPSLEGDDKNILDSFLEYLYGHSKEILIIPNITKKIISLTDYIKFIDYCYSFFSVRNSKPIFVPVSMRMSMQDIRELIGYYLKKEYYYIWFDFEGKPMNKSTSSRIRAIRSLTESKEIFDKVIFYFTNIRREIITNPKTDNSASSDILATIGGANIVGINREPSRFNPNMKIEEISQQEIWAHKARFFDSQTYYYKKFVNGVSLEPKDKNIINNSHKLDEELKKQAKVFLEKLKIKDYINEKPIVKENPFISKLLLN